jgi:uncharacterized protein
MAVQSEIMKESRKNEEKLKGIPPEDRILLISHCLRFSDTCGARMGKRGLQCRDDCKDRCSIGRLRMLAEDCGYKGICIAPGGSMALKFIRDTRPAGIVAIACMKELEEGVCAVKELVEAGKNSREPPVIVSVPLLKDGCVDTEVDEDEAERIIRL